MALVAFDWFKPQGPEHSSAEHQDNNLEISRCYDKNLSLYSFQQFTVGYSYLISLVPRCVLEWKLVQYFLPIETKEK